MRTLQIIFGKTLVPDSSIIFLQTIANPFYPFTSISKSFMNGLKNTDAEFDSKLVQSDNDDIILEDILQLLKPKIVDILSDLANSGVLDKIHPIVNLTIESASQDYDSKNGYLTNVNNSIAYDLIDFSRFNKTKYKDEPYELNYPMINPMLSDLLTKKQINLTEEVALFNSTSNSTSNDVIANSSLIDKEEEFKKQDKSLSVKEEDKFEFRGLNVQLNETDFLNLNQTDNLLNQLNSQTNQTNQTNQAENENQIANEQAQLDNNQASQLNETEINGKLNNTEYAFDDSSDLDKPIVSLVTCDGNKCKEENLEEFLNRPMNKTDYKEKPTADANSTNKTSNTTNEISNLGLLKNNLIVKPAVYIKESAIRLAEIIKRDLHILFKMAQSLIGITSPTCRYKFLCLFSSFFSLHTPNFLKSNMPKLVENYYLKIMEAANRHEYLNALVTGYLGDQFCHENYIDKRCPE